LGRSSISGCIGLVAATQVVNVGTSDIYIIWVHVERTTLFFQEA
jgi:hypothetical protein